MGMPLWPDEWGEPQVIADLRLGLFGRLHRENVEWAVWIGWYDDRLKGKPVEAPLFRAWALLPDGLWAIGPEAVNPVLRVLNEAWRDGGPDALQEAFRHNYARYAPEAKMPDLLINGKGPPSSDTRHEVRPSADRAETVRDLLGRASIAFQLATHLNRIWSQQTERRTAIEAAASDEAAYIAHIDAPWGGGKTTFANFVARMLNPDAFGIARDHALFAGLPFDKGKWAGGFGERKWIPIVYNAWRHQHVSPPWWNFYEAIHRQATAAMGRGWYWFYRLDEFVWRLFTPNLFRTLLVLVLTGAVAYGLYSIPLFNALLTADSGKTNDFGKLLVLALTGGGGLVLINSLRTGFRALVESVGSSADAATLGEADPLPRFRNHFRRLIERINRPLLVIIDDLDRCEPDYVVELVRGLMTIFNSSRVVFVLLGDKRWIEQSFAIVHEKMKPAHAGDEVPFGARFAEKAIQLSFVLPEPGETERSGYVRALLIGEEPSAAQPVEVAEQDLDALRDFAAHAEASLEPAVSIEEQNAQLASLRATAETRFAGSGDTVRDAAQRVLYSKAALRAGTSEATEHETRHALLTIVDRLPVNPRRIKRILNMVSIYQLTALELQQVALGSHEWKQLVLWIILMSERAEAWKEICATGTVAEPDDLIRALLGDVMFDDETVRIDADALKWLRRLTPVV